MIQLVLVILLAISLSMDAFSLSVCFGTLNLSYKKILSLSLIVGIFHFIMPLLGMSVAHIILRFIKFNPKYITFITFLALGLFMILDKEDKNTKKLSGILSMLLFALAVSIDSLIAGIGLNMIYDNHLISALTFSIFSGIFTLLGLLIGKYINSRIGNISKVIGGIILIAFSIIYLTK